MPELFEGYLFEMVRFYGSRNLMIELNKRAIDGSEVGSIFISGEMKSHVKDESVYLSVQFNSKVRHFCNKIILLLERS